MATGRRSVQCSAVVNWTSQYCERGTTLCHNTGHHPVILYSVRATVPRAWQSIERPLPHYLRPALLSTQFSHTGIPTLQWPTLQDTTQPCQIPVFPHWGTHTTGVPTLLKYPHYCDQHYEALASTAHPLTSAPTAARAGGRQLPGGQNLLKQSHSWRGQNYFHNIGFLVFIRLPQTYKT